MAGLDARTTDDWIAYLELNILYRFVLRNLQRHLGTCSHAPPVAFLPSGRLCYVAVTLPKLMVCKPQVAPMDTGCFAVLACSWHDSGGDKCLLGPTAAVLHMRYLVDMGQALAR